MIFPYVEHSKKFINYWILFVILFLILSFTILFKKYDYEENYIGLNENGKTKFLIKEENIISLPKSVIYQNEKYDYKIENISDEYYMDNNINYKMITINADYKTDEKIINLKFVKGKTRIFLQILKIIKGG